MTGKKSTGVFVRLHDGQLNENQINALYNPKRSGIENLLAIGTPVQATELWVAAFANSKMPLRPWGAIPILFEVSDRRTESFNMPLVLQSEAHSRIMDRDAEIVQLRDGLTVIASSDDVENAIDPERNKRIARYYLKGGAA